MPARLPELERRDNSPCPRGNGTEIGSDQQFTVFCGINSFGNVIDKPDADSFTQCVDLCSSHHPKCEGVSFSGKRCLLHSDVNLDKAKPAKVFDTAVGIFPQASSECQGLNGQATSSGSNFGTFCNNIINGKDIGQAFAATFLDCMGQCGATGGCGGVSFDASMAQGFKNCYMKSQVAQGDMIVDQGIDTAILNAAPAVANPVPAPAPAPDTTAAVIPATTPSPVIPVITPASTEPAAPPASTGPLSELETTSGGTFITLTPATTPEEQTVPPPSAVTLETIVTAVPSASETIFVTSVVTIPITNTATKSISVPAAESSGANGIASESSANSSRAWIAAPVVGSIAAVVLIVMVFIMWGRKRKASGQGTRLWFDWLPLPRRKPANFSSVTGNRVSVSQDRWRSSGASYWRPGGMEKIGEDEEVGSKKDGKAVLRNSLNGLSQNRPILDGIPGLYSKPSSSSSRD